MTAVHKACMLILALFTTCCASNMAMKTTAAVPDQMRDATVAFIIPDEDNHTHTYCSGVWVDQDLILTAHHCAVGAVLMNMEKTMAPEQFRILQKLIEVGLVTIDVNGIEMDYAVDGQMHTMGVDAEVYNPGNVVAADETHDLVLVKVAKDHPKHRFAPLATESPAIGEAVVIMGHPRGLTWTFMRGYVSAYREKMEGMDLNKEGPFLQVDFSVAGGVSGGGIYNQDGELVAITSFMVLNTHQGFGIALPSLRKFVETYKQGISKK